MMIFFKSKLTFCFSLLLYTLLLAAVTLYFRFPMGNFTVYCQSQLEEIFPGTSCSIGSIGYGFPFALTATDVRFNEKKLKKEELFTLDSIHVTPVLTAPLAQFSVLLDAFGGSHSFTLITDVKEKKFSLQEILVEGLDPTRIPFLVRGTGRKITGTVAASGEYHGAWKDKKYTAEASGKMKLSSGNFSLLLPILAIKSVDLKEFSTDFQLQDKKLQCDNGAFRGKELKGSFAGVLGLTPTLKSATLSFTGDLEPLPDLLKKNKTAQKMVTRMKKSIKRGAIPFTLQGVVQKPGFRFDS